jgi:hypothetical protein
MHKLLSGNPATIAAAITPSDSAVYSPEYNGLYVGGAGNVAVIPKGQSTSVTLVGVLAGSVLPIQVSKVLSTGTTATNIVGLR